MLKLRLFWPISRSFLPMILNESNIQTRYSKTFVLGLPRLSRTIFHNNVCLKRNCAQDDNSYNINCNSCSKSIKVCEFKCPYCGHFHIPDETQRSYFQIFEEQQMYKLNEEKLKQKFRILQSEYHPDKFATNGENERNISEQVSSFINKAYTTLSNPYERGVYLLKLHGIEMSESDTQQLDKEFLMEIMELNEEVEQINDTEKLLKFEEDNDLRIRIIANNVAVAFKSKDYMQAKMELQRMKYFISLRYRIREKKTKSSF